MSTNTRVRLSQIFREDSVVRLNETDKDAAVRECVEHLVNIGKLRRSRAEKTAKTVLGRENIGSTGIGQGVGIPHAELDFLKSYLGVIGISEKGIDYKAIDGKKVRYVFMFLTPPDRRDEHMQILRQVVRFVQDGNCLKWLAGARNSGEIHELLADLESEL